MVVLCSAAMPLGCGRARGSAPEPPGDAAFERGARVVIERAAGEFFEARVLARAAGRLEVQQSEGGSFDVAEAEAYSLSLARRALAEGDVGVCNVEGSLWVACRVVSVQGERIEVDDLEARRWSLTRSSLLDPSEFTAMNVRRRFQRSDARRAFELELKQAGPPRAPGSWRPAAGERVLGVRERAWYSGRVREVDDDVVFVEWAADGRQVELAAEWVVPEPPYDFEPRRGQYALARPAAPASPWEAVRVLAVVAEDSVRGQDASGEKRELSLRDVVPLD
jgi:hypothetical protein